MLSMPAGVPSFGRASRGCPSASPAVADGRVYALSSDGYFYSFDAKTGKFIWSYATSPCNCYYFAPAVANGVVYYDVDITVYALDARDGTLLWSYDTGGIFGPPVVANGVLYVVAEFSGLWAFGLKGQDYCGIRFIQGATLWISAAGNHAVQLP